MGDALGTAGRRGVVAPAAPDRHVPRPGRDRHLDAMPPPPAWPGRSTTPGGSSSSASRIPTSRRCRASSCRRAAAASLAPGETPAPSEPATPAAHQHPADRDRFRREPVARPQRHDPRGQPRPDDGRPRDGQLPARPGPPADARRQDLHGQDQLADDLRRQAPEASTPRAGWRPWPSEVGFLLGAPVDYYASVDLDGFRKLIDRVGGVTVNVQTAINDPDYGGWDTPGKIGFKISTGQAHPRRRDRPRLRPHAQGHRRQRLRPRPPPAAAPRRAPAQAGRPGDAAEPAGAPQGRDQDAQDQLPARPASPRSSSSPARPTRRRSRSTSSGRPTRPIRRT